MLFSLHYGSLIYTEGAAVISRSRNTNELSIELSEQRKALLASCTNYDSGNNDWEAKRIATSVFNLVNDNPRNSSSILSQLRIRKRFKYFSSIKRPNLSVITLASFGTPLTLLRLNVGQTAESTYRPYLSDLPHQPVGFVEFDQWWNGDTIFVNSANATLTRLNLTCALRSKDGGSHYDETLPESPYTDLKSTAPLVVGEDGKPVPPTHLAKNAHLASMRQIAWELEYSLSQAEGIFKGL